MRGDDLIKKIWPRFTLCHTDILILHSYTVSQRWRHCQVSHVNVNSSDFSKQIAPLGLHRLQRSVIKLINRLILRAMPILLQSVYLINDLI